MTLLLAVALVLVALSGATVLLTRSPLAQAVVLSVHGLFLTVAFVVTVVPWTITTWLVSPERRSGPYA